VASVGETTQDAACTVLRHDPSLCVGCGVCGLMCALSREGGAGPDLSRSDLVRDPFTSEFSLNVCRQCRSPRCYSVCPLQGFARVIDDATGIVYVNQDACVGCGACVDACRFDPPRTKLHPERGVALSCDRCFERDGGPICVEYCPMGALSCVSGNTPRRPSGRRGRP
jgi:Fe-S-cluster-containing dehydrogenase component